MRRGTGRLLPRVASVVALSLLVACGGTNTAPIAATPTAAPTPSAIVAPSLGRPSTEPSADPGAAAVRAFIAYASSPAATYQATFSGESRQTITVIRITKGTLQGRGSDVLVRATFTFPDRNADVVEHRYVGGVAWFRVGTRSWQKAADFTPANTMAAFAAVHGPADVTYLGPRTVGGKHLFAVSIASAIVNPVMIPEINLTEAAVTDPNLTLLVDASGRPVSGTSEIRGRGRVSGQLQELVIDLTVTFTKIGEPVSVNAP